MDSISRLRELRDSDTEWHFLVRQNECEVYRVTNQVTAQAAQESGWHVIDLMDALTYHEMIVSSAASELLRK